MREIEDGTQLQNDFGDNQQGNEAGNYHLQDHICTRSK